MLPAALGLALLLATGPANQVPPANWPRGEAERSPDGLLEFYSTPNGVTPDVHGKPYYFGERLFLRLRNSKAPGLFLMENDRWMNVTWVPHSHFLAVEDDWDTHSSQVYIFEIWIDPPTRQVHTRLVFHSPDNDYDVQWFIEGWDLPHRRVHLRREERPAEVDAHGRRSYPETSFKITHYSFPIGTVPLKLYGPAPSG